MQPQQLQVKATDDDVKGHYANNMITAFTAEEFLIDFILMNPAVHQLVSRIIVNPAHAKRIAKALHENVLNYEKQYGEIKDDSGQKAQMGFRTSSESKL